MRQPRNHHRLTHNNPPGRRHAGLWATSRTVLRTTAVTVLRTTTRAGRRHAGLWATNRAAGRRAGL